jgi:hypothetical protein
MGCPSVVFIGLIEYCLVLYISKVEKKIKIFRFLERNAKVDSKIILVDEDSKRDSCNEVQLIIKIYQLILSIVGLCEIQRITDPRY